MYNQEQLTNILKKTFGFDTFRPGQLEAIMTLLRKDCLLSIQPTGHGKSLLYQLPAILLEGITVVISPLLALMRDQLQQLNKRFNIPAASINSDQTDFENSQAQKQALDGKIRILFISPEQLDNLDRLNFLFRLPIALLVVDEAHCISTWGHDFRPSYRTIIKVIHAIKEKQQQNKSKIKILGLTATANQKTENDIIHQLSVNADFTVLRSAMDRPNIQLSVINISSIAEKLAVILQLLFELKGCGIVYCATRENTELVAEYLNKQGINAAAYHAGFNADEKRQLQIDFIDNKYRIIAATNALGMGIDKADLRFIIHFDMPGSITAYYQEVGRCGRDGKPAQGILLFDSKDKKIQQYFIDSSQPQRQDFNKVIEIINNSKEKLNITALKRETGLHPTRINVVVAELMEQNFLEKVHYQRLQVYQLTQKKDKIDLSRYENLLIIKIQELENMMAYGKEQVSCLMAYLRKVLGDRNPQLCGHCNLCLQKSSSPIIEAQVLDTTNIWLFQRVTKIAPVKTNIISEGEAIFDSRMRTFTFMDFMRKRTKDSDMSNELLALLKEKLFILNKKYHFSCIIPIPSRTWYNRNMVSQFMAEHLKVPALIDTLSWIKLPVARQGELLNNDQRNFNVDKHMTANLSHLIPTTGAILLFDDYTGSGATLKEASRALRKVVGPKQGIVPFTIAAIKWRLGKSGMI